jgi:hypothetical protein
MCVRIYFKVYVFVELDSWVMSVLLPDVVAFMYFVSDGLG